MFTKNGAVRIVCGIAAFELISVGGMIHQVWAGREVRIFPNGRTEVTQIPGAWDRRQICDENGQVVQSIEIETRFAGFQMCNKDLDASAKLVQAHYTVGTAQGSEELRVSPLGFRTNSERIVRRFSIPGSPAALFHGAPDIEESEHTYALGRRDSVSFNRLDDGIMTTVFPVTIDETHPPSPPVGEASDPDGGVEELNQRFADLGFPSKTSQGEGIRIVQLDEATDSSLVLNIEGVDVDGLEMYEGREFIADRLSNDEKIGTAKVRIVFIDGDSDQIVLAETE